MVLPRRRESARRTSQDPGYEVICFDPETDTTRARPATSHSWPRTEAGGIDLATTDQATRARMMVSRCWDGEVASVTVPTDESRIGRIVYEWGAMLRATIERRGC